MPIANTPGHCITIQRDFLQKLDLAPNVVPPAGAASAEQAIDSYRQGIEILRHALGSGSAAQGLADAKLQQLGEFIADGIRAGFTPETREQFLQQAQQDFTRFCALVQQPDMPQDARRHAILNLLQGMDVCAPGVAQHIETAARELQALTDMAAHFRHQLTIAIEEKIQDHLREHRICKHAGNEIHYVAAFFNHLAPHFGLPPRTDALLPKALAPAVLDAGARQVLDADPVERVVAQMAQDYLARVAEFYASHQHEVHAQSLDLLAVDAMYRKFDHELKPALDRLFGPVENGIFFHTSSTGEGERYWLTSDVTLVARAIARNLREARVIGFTPAYVVGTAGAGLKLKQLGQSLFYVSDTRSPAADAQEPYMPDAAAKNLHQYHTLDQFVLQDMERGRQLLDQLDQLDQNAQAARDDFWRKMPASLYREMKDAPDVQEAAGIFQQTLSLLDSAHARHGFALQMLEQARLGNQPHMLQRIFAQLSPQQLAADRSHAAAVLVLALKHDNAGFALQLIEAMDPATLGDQDEDGYTLLMHALENHQAAATLQLIQRMSPEQINLQEIDGNNALMGALITSQATAAEAIIRKLDAAQLHVQNANGYTPLMLALIFGQAEAAKDIIDRSSRKQLLLQNHEGSTARVIALRCGQTEIARFLREKSNRVLSWFYRQ